VRGLQRRACAISAFESPLIASRASARPAEVRRLAATELPVGIRITNSAS
jgi:hypothetical protein